MAGAEEFRGPSSFFEAVERTVSDEETPDLVVIRAFADPELYPSVFWALSHPLHTGEVDPIFRAHVPNIDEAEEFLAERWKRDGYAGLEFMGLKVGQLVISSGNPTSHIDDAQREDTVFAMAQLNICVGEERLFYGELLDEEFKNPDGTFNAHAYNNRASGRHGSIDEDIANGFRSVNPRTMVHLKAGDAAIFAQHPKVNFHSSKAVNGKVSASRIVDGIASKPQQ